MPLPTTMKAIKVTGEAKAEIVDNEPLPPVRDGYILVKVSYVALNPTDWKHLDQYPNIGATLGCDFSGTVAALGSNLSKPWTVGERVAGVVHGSKEGNLHSGCFAEYTEMRAHVGIRLPDSLSHADACTIPVAALTIGLGLHQRLNVPWADQVGYTRPASVLVYGGSTSMGLLAIQSAKLSGLHVLATCSPRNFDKLKALGADEVFDYNDAEACTAAIKKATDNKLLYAFDSISESTSPQICFGALTDEPGRAHYLSLLPVDEVRSKEDVWQSFLFAYTGFGEPFHDLGMDWDVKPDDEAYTARWFIEVERLLAAGKFKAFPIMREGGLSEEGIIKGMDELRQGKVSGGKLVYKVA